SQDGAELQSDDGDGGADHGRRGGALGRARRDRSGLHPYTRHLRAADHQGRTLRQSDRAAHGSQAQRRLIAAADSQDVDTMALTRDQLAQRAARELRDGYYVNLGIGIPTLVANYIPPDMKVVLQ